ncbi:MauE/DoxX family redox-associated membrane protein [Flavobacterium sp. SM2513]|uniref:MauE/DoxX family redox-associated membrane protein n=1 Tax=Flavobacterium sp. SM2513 TaxID=3424766 RepID=UPI003D7F476D
MKTTAKFNTTVIAIISYLFVFLFIYAAISKLLDYNDFSIKIGQSPLLSPFAGYVAIGVPVIELIIAVGLLIPNWRIISLFAALCLMTAFTVYIFIILNFSSFVPCSCGGILEKLGWTEHLIFNLVFVVLAIIGLILSENHASDWISSKKPLPFTVTVISGITISALSIISLFLISEHIMHKRNNFVRRFPTHAEPEYKKLDLGLNSYYFAGNDDKTIYLGNYKAPAYVAIVDTSLKTKDSLRIQPDQPNLPFKDIKLSVVPPHFFITDGTIPAIFKGNTSDWKATRQTGQIPYFTALAAMDSLSIALRLTSLKKMRHTLAVYNLEKQKLLVQNTTLLKKQIDGIFDADGMLLYNQQNQQLHYIFYYRNQFITSNRNLKLVSEGKTIDTVAIAKIKVSKMTNGGKEIATPPLVINKTTSVYKNLLFIKSDRIGKFEDKNMINEASIIDVYNLNNNTYVGSQYIYDIEKAKLRNFKIIQNKLYGLYGSYLAVVTISDKITEAYQKE